MYSFVDQPHGRLAGGSHFLLWAMRCWALCRQRGRCPVVCMAPSFAKARMSAALGDFDAVMHALHQAAPAHMSFADHGYPCITESEAVMLALWCDLAEEQSERVRSMLGIIAPAMATEPLMVRLGRILGAMALVALLPSRSLKSSTAVGEGPL